MKAKYLRILLVNCALLSTFVLLGEVLLQASSGNKRLVPGRVGRATIYDRKKLDIIPRFSTFSPSDKTNHVVDSLGPEIARKNCSVLFVGGSTTEEAIHTTQERWVYKFFSAINLSHNLPASCRQGVKVVNAGVGGHTTWGNYSDLRFWLNKELRNSGLVVVYQGINDNHNGYRSQYLDITSRLLGRDLALAVRQWRVSSESWLRYNSYIYSSVRYLLDFASSRRTDRPAKRPPDEPVEVLTIKKPIGLRPKTIAISDKLILRVMNLSRYQAYLYEIRALYKEILSSGASLVVITQTYPFCDLSNDSAIQYVEFDADEFTSAGGVPSSTLEEQLNRSLVSSARDFCARVYFNRLAQMQVMNDLMKRGLHNVGLIDYAGYKKIHLNEISLDTYHKDPDGSEVLFSDFSDLGLIGLSRRMLSLNE